MQTIKKFHPNTIYSSSSSKNTFQLLERNGHHLIFRVWKANDRISYIISATSTNKADEKGAFEEILLMDGSRVQSDSPAKTTRVYNYAA